MSWLGLDIGGANLKAANPQGWACSKPFALWREPEGLAAALRTAVDSAPACDKVAVTMTGELCDCFSSKVEGVRSILEAAEAAAGGRRLLAYLADGRFVTIAEAKRVPKLTAASNWHALATYAARYVQRGSGLLIDVGSTTTDVIPIKDGKVIARSLTDTERLLSRELIYAGVGRTPVCAITASLPLRGEVCPIAAEVFATTADAYLLLGYLEEDPLARWTADGRGLTEDFSRRRLARQVCADVDELADSEFEIMALAIAEAQLTTLANAIEAAASKECRAFTAVVSGSGEFLTAKALERVGDLASTISLTAELGAATSRAAGAFAVAILATELEGEGSGLG